jgi:hypothetical protein
MTASPVLADPAEVEGVANAEGEGEDDFEDDGEADPDGDSDPDGAGVGLALHPTRSTDISVEATTKAVIFFISSSYFRGVSKVRLVFSSIL